VGSIVVVVGAFVIWGSTNSLVGTSVGESVSCCPEIGSVGLAVGSIVVVGALVICLGGNVGSGTSVGESVSCCPVMGSVGNAVGSIAVGIAVSSMFAISVGVLVVGNLVAEDDIGVVVLGEGGLKGDEAGDEPSS
jgi:hypothetical protein